MQRLVFISNLFPDRDSPLRGLDNAVLLRELARDIDIRVISPRPTLRRAAVERLTALPDDAEIFTPQYVPVPYVPKFGSRWNARLMRRALRKTFEQVVADHRPDAVLTSWLFPDTCAVAPLAKQHGLPHVLITQGSDTHCYLADSARRRQIIAAIDQADAVICRSANLGNRLANAGAQREKLHTVYNGVDTTVFQPYDRQLARRKIEGEPEQGDCILVFVGNFLPVKNPLFLLRAHAELIQRSDRRVLMYMLGSGPMEAEMRSGLDSLGTTDSVIFTGPLPSPQVAVHMQAADVLCMTSHNEGLPNVILEAMACQLPVVSTDVGGIAELVDRPGRGQLVSTGDLAGYVDALEQAIASPQVNKNADSDNKSFTWSRVARDYRQILEKSAGNAPRNDTRK